jgi:hypothetical protein
MGKKLICGPETNIWVGRPCLKNFIPNLKFAENWKSSGWVILNNSEVNPSRLRWIDGKG